MTVFPVAGVEGEDKGQVQFQGLIGRRLAQQEGMVSVNDVQLQDGQDPVDEGRNGNDDRKFIVKRQFDGRIAKDKGVFVLVFAVILRKNKDIMTGFG